MEYLVQLYEIWYDINVISPILETLLSFSVRRRTSVYCVLELSHGV